MKIAYRYTGYRLEEEENANVPGLRDEMKKALIALESAYSGFDNATDPDMIDCHIYRINSALKRYRYLLLQAETLHEYSEDDMPSRKSDHSFQNTVAVPVTTPMSLYEVTP